jgi:hypothetical protein
LRHERSARRTGGEPRRSAFERIVARVAPRWDDDVRPPPREIAPGLWSIDRRIVLPGGSPLPARALLAALPDGELLAWSPVPLQEELRAQVEALGRVRFVVAPSSFHYLGVASWLAAWPDAALFLAPALAERRPELPRGVALDEGAATPFADTLPHTVLAPRGLVSEVAFLHRPSRSLILVDACFHIGHCERARDRWAWRLNGVYRRLGPSWTARVGLLRGRARVADFVERLCRWDFDRVVVAHGDVAESTGPAALRAAFARRLR